MIRSYVFLDLNWFLRWAMWPMGFLFGDIIDCFHISFTGFCFGIGCKIFNPVLIVFPHVCYHFFVFSSIMCSSFSLTLLDLVRSILYFNVFLSSTSFQLFALIHSCFFFLGRWSFFLFHCICSWISPYDSLHLVHQGGQRTCFSIQWRISLWFQVFSACMFRNFQMLLTSFGRDMQLHLNLMTSSLWSLPTSVPLVTLTSLIDFLTFFIDSNMVCV